MQRRMLSKEDEAALSEEVQVRREDQDKINRFSRLHQKELLLQEQVESNKKEEQALKDEVDGVKELKELQELEDPDAELSVDDEEESDEGSSGSGDDEDDGQETDTASVVKDAASKRFPYRVGDTFVMLPYPTIRNMNRSARKEVIRERKKLENSMSSQQEEMEALKVALYARFGKGINLES
ncbi:MAG: hypothetical protein M1828_005080 [Chrysothrix sp. TS-e1954]|nr:MAG: hypothetical protein M1828_005080 [Chrysothrix sp. TS-e1954]